MKYNYPKPRHVFVTLYLVISLFPIVWMFITSIKPPGELTAYPVIFIPHRIDWNYYVQVFQGGALHSLMTSIIVAIANTLVSLALGLPAAYSIARWQTGGNNLSFWFLSQRMLPPIVVVVPVFILFSHLRWVDTYQAFIIIYITFNLPYVIWMMRGFFREVQQELYESAEVDGARSMRVFVEIALPIARNGIIATSVFCFVFSWLEFLFALILSRTHVITLPVFMTGLVGEYTQWGVVNALSVVMSIPTFIISVTLTRYLARGLSLGGVK